MEPALTAPCGLLLRRCVEADHRSPALPWLLDEDEGSRRSIGNLSDQPRARPPRCGGPTSAARTTGADTTRLRAMAPPAPSRPLASTTADWPSPAPARASTTSPPPGATADGGSRQVPPPAGCSRALPRQHRPAARAGAAAAAQMLTDGGGSSSSAWAPLLTRARGGRRPEGTPGRSSRPGRRRNRGFLDVPELQ